MATLLHFIWFYLVASFCLLANCFQVKYNAFVHWFCDWKHSERIGEHERSEEQRACMEHSPSKNTGRVDFDLVKENDAQRQYWWEVLKESLLSGRGALLSGR